MRFPGQEGKGFRLMQECATTARFQPGPPPKFAHPGPFQAELKRRVDAWFEETGRRRRDCPEMYLKSAILIGAFIGIYIALVFWAQTWWQVVPLAILMGLSTASIGFNVQHDGGHQAYSEHKWVNRLAALAMDAIGASSYVWRWKHGVFHHTYTNIAGHDSDIDLGHWGRLSPNQPRLPFHRWQHWYLWPLYGLMVNRWEFWTDFENVIAGRVGKQKIPRPTLRDTAVLIVGKIFFFTLAFGLPLMRHPLWAVFSAYLIFTMVLGLTLSVVFQLAHCVQEAEFPLPSGNTGDMENTWFIHQIETTVDFARGSRVASWLLGGLNFQIEHHLFPRVCHVNYPAMSKVVEQTCREFGIRYTSHASVWSGIRSHYIWLRRMGREDAPAH